MSFIIFDYRCSSGNKTVTRMVRRERMDDQWCEQDCCGDYSQLMTRLPAGTRTTFRFADTKLKG